MTAALRTRLQELTSGPAASLDEMPDLIAELAKEIPHSIELVRNPPPLSISRYNCFEFAFGLAGDPRVHVLSENLSHACCNSEFAASLARSLLAPVAPPSTGDLILYHYDQQITHAGVMTDGLIISKWGIGQLWRHGIFEVPAQYGSAVSFHRAPASADVLNHFLEFARVRNGAELVDSLLELLTA